MGYIYNLTMVLPLTEISTCRDFRRGEGRDEGSLCSATAEIARKLRRFLALAQSRSVWSAWSLLPLWMTRGVRQRGQAPRTPNASRGSVAALPRCRVCPAVFSLSAEKLFYPSRICS